ncbi:Uncharacterised protein [uncultured Blautia sp.]|nr:Uncharacterised protein [uncultured Blautia sp.]
MVGAGDPQRGVALHPLEAGQDVLQCAVQGVAHVELARDVGWRHDDGEGLLLGIRIPVKAVVVLPHLVDAGLHLLGFIHLGQFFHHTFDLSLSISIIAYFTKDGGWEHRSFAPKKPPAPRGSPGSWRRPEEQYYGACPKTGSKFSGRIPHSR